MLKIHLPVFRKLPLWAGPNAGKSSLLWNALVGNERSIVTDEARHDTRFYSTRATITWKRFYSDWHGWYSEKSKGAWQRWVLLCAAFIKMHWKNVMCVSWWLMPNENWNRKMWTSSRKPRNKAGIIILWTSGTLIEKDTKTADAFKKEMNEAIAPIDYLPIILDRPPRSSAFFKRWKKAVQVYQNKSQKDTHLGTERCHASWDRALSTAIRKRQVYSDQICATRCHTLRPRSRFLQPAAIRYESYQRFWNRLREIQFRGHTRTTVLPEEIFRLAIWNGFGGHALMKFYIFLYTLHQNTLW